MNLGTRAILYTARKWRKTLLLFCLLLSITTLVLSGLAISDAQEEQAEELGELLVQVLPLAAILRQVAGAMVGMVRIARRNILLPI